MAKTKLTPETQNRICTLIRGGNWAYVAAEAVGIHRLTYHAWMRYGRNAQQRGERNKYREFAEAVDKAASEGEALFVDRIRRAAEDGDVAAVRWWLIHRFPGRWGLQQSRLEHSGEGGGPVVIKVIRAGPRPQKPDNEEEVSG